MRCAKTLDFTFAGRPAPLFAGTPATIIMKNPAKADFQPNF
jgi:hypothetical protein